MLVKDVRRNLTVSLTLIILMMLSVVLATASTGLLARLAGSSDRLLERADAPHVVQMHAGPLEPEDVARWAAARPEVTAHGTHLLLGIDGADLSFDGVNQVGNVQQNSLVVPNLERDLLLDADNRPVTDVEPGTVWLPVYYEIEEDLQPGALVTVTGPDGFRHDLTVAGFVRDSIMNTAIASSKRLAVHPADLDLVAAHTGTPEHLISFWLEDPDTQIAGFRKAYQDDRLPSAGPMVDRATFTMFNMISEGIVAGVVILAALLLMLVGLLCLRLSFLTAVQQDRREIGVLAAIGVAPRGISRIYLAKYAAFGAVACSLGLLGGLALAPALSTGLNRYLGTGGGAALWLAPALTAVAVFALILVFVRLLLRRLNRISPVAALRATEPGGKAWTRGLKLHRMATPTNVSLGLIDLSRRWTMFVLLFFVFVVSVFIMVVPSSAALTVRSPQFLTYMGVGPADVRMDLQYADDSSAELFDAAVDTLAAAPDVAEFTALTTTRHEVGGTDGTSVNLYVESGDHDILPVSYADGRAPSGEGEIALSLLALAETGHRVGDTLDVTVAGSGKQLAIVGSYQDITHGGKTAKAQVPEGGGDTMWYVLAARLTDASQAEPAAERLSGQLPGVRVSEVDRYREQQLGPIAGQITFAGILSALAAMLLAVLMTMMFTRMLLASDRGQVAIQRAIGATDRDVRAQYLTRILAVLVLAVPVGLLGAATVGERLFNLIFEVMFGGTASLLQGTSQIDLLIGPALAAAVAAALILAVGAATAVATREVGNAGISSLNVE